MQGRRSTGRRSEPSEPAALPPARRQAVELLGRELDALVALKAEAEKAMLRESHRHRIARILETAPGFGADAGRPAAADRDHAVAIPDQAAVLGLLWLRRGDALDLRLRLRWGWWIRTRVPQTRGLNFNHNRTLKSIFKGAATTVIAHMGPNPLEDRTTSAGSRTGPNPIWRSSRLRDRSPPSCWRCGRQRRSTTRGDTENLQGLSANCNGAHSCSRSRREPLAKGSRGSIRS